MAPETKLYLITPPAFERAAFAEILAETLDVARVDCVRLRLTGATEDELRRAIDALRPICHARDVAFLVSTYFRLAAETEIDGVHFELGENWQAEARGLLGPDAIIGVSCGASRHLGLTAGERGADYVAFGPIAVEGALQTGDVADRALLEWWQEMIELPVVAESGVTAENVHALIGAADFIALDRAVWDAPDGPAAAMRRISSALSAGGA